MLSCEASAVTNSDFHYYIILCGLSKEGSLQEVNDAIKNVTNVNARHNGEISPLILAATMNPNPEVITTLLKNGADPGIKTTQVKKQ